MIGTLVNVVAIIVGSLIGLLLGSRFPDRIKQTLLVAIALSTIGLGIQMFLQASNVLLVLVSLLVGGLVGEAVDLESKLHSLGVRLEALLSRAPGGRGSQFVRGFVASACYSVLGRSRSWGQFKMGCWAITVCWPPRGSWTGWLP
jgi:uncharacterized membrane protein YqgA involved in biofilm formation